MTMPEMLQIHGVHSLLLLLLGLMAAVAGLAGWARKHGVSYPIALMLAGLLVSIVPGLPRIPLPPDVVFLIFLPPLLYSSAWQTSWREFKYNLVSIGMLALGLVFFTALGVAFIARRFMPGFDWRLGFLLGAIVAPTDAVAASSIARRVGMPARIVQVLEGESLLNDATGLLALEFGLEMIVQGSTPSLSQGLLRLLILIAGGVVIGLLTGKVSTWIEGFVDDGPVEIVFSFVVPYAAYLIADSLHTSGVIAVVVCGLYMSRQSSTFFSAATRLQAWSVWESVEFLLNGLVFLLMGLQLPAVMSGLTGMSRPRLALNGLLFTLVLIALRLLWSFPGALIAWVIRRKLLHQRDSVPSKTSIFVVGWVGMRGVVALAAASSLPYTLGDGRPFSQRNLIVYLTFCTILVTLVAQGITLPWVIRLIGLRQPPQQQCEEAEARRIVLRGVLEYLEEQRDLTADGERHAFDDLIHAHEHRLEEITDCGPDGPAAVDHEARTLNNVSRELMHFQRNMLLELRETGRISDEVHRTLEREIDLGESRLELQAR